MQSVRIKPSHYAQRAAIPIATDIRNRFKRHSEEVVDKAIRRSSLRSSTSRRCTWLLQRIFPSKYARRAKSSDIGNSDREPRLRIQFAELGEKVIGGFIAERFKQWLSKLVGRFLVEKCVLFILTSLLTFLLGVLITVGLSEAIRKVLPLPFVSPCTPGNFSSPTSEGEKTTDANEESAKVIRL